MTDGGYSFFFSRKWNVLDCCMSLCQLQGGKYPQQPKTQQNPKILPINHPIPQKKHPTTQTIQDQNGAYIKDKNDFNELWFIRRYGISDSRYLFCWEQSKSQELLTLIKLARRCRSGMHYLVLTCIPWNHKFIAFDFWGASVPVWSPETKLVCNFCHELNQCLVFLQPFSFI